MENLEESLHRILRRAEAARQAGDVLAGEDRPRVCPHCQGAGYLRHDVPVDDPRFGELIICECTRAELDAKRQTMLMKRSQLADVADFTFDKWEEKIVKGAPPLNHPDAAYHTALLYTESLEIEGRPWLFLYGTKGTGKTHLAAAIGHERVRRGQPAIFMPVPDLLGHLRRTFAPNSDVSYDELFEDLRNTQLLILDDMGTHMESDWAREKLFQLINHRYNRRLPTVITMNMEGEPIDERLWSRINDWRLTTRCEVTGKDFREGKRPATQPKGHPLPQRSRSRTA
jgi:DNA replication protein DnaC